MLVEYKRILRKAGLVLVLGGLADIGWMAYCVANSVSYSSSFNIVAVIAGLFLVAGSLKATRFVTWCAAFYFTTFGTMMLLWPLIEPLDLLVVRARLNPVGIVLSFALGLSVVAVLLWVYRRLRSETILQALEEHELKSTPPKSAFAGAILLVAILIVILGSVLNGESAQEAVKRARERLGPDYRYHVNAIYFAGGHVSARVVAYTSTSIEAIEIEWEQ